MSMCVRKTLEIFIRNQKNKVLQWLSQLKREAIINLIQDKIMLITQLEGVIGTLSPLISSYTNPEQYVTALKSHSLVLSFLNVMLENYQGGSTSELIDKAQRIISVLKSGTSLDVGGIITESKAYLSELQDLGEKIYLEGSRRYLSTIIESCGYSDLSRSEMFLLKDSIDTLVIYSSRPFITIEEIGVKMGINEKEVREIVKKLVKDNPEIINKDNIITTLNKIESWITNAIREESPPKELETVRRYFPKEVEKAYLATITKTTKNILKMLEEM